MAERRGARAPALAIADLEVRYGAARAIQGVSLTLDRGILAVVGRNGMGKSTLCQTICGLKEAERGSVRVAGREVLGLEPHLIHRLGVGYVPQGRRVWPSLTVEEHLRLVATGDGPWTLDRVYATFPRLAERRGSGGTQLSGGEQQMLAIGRALLGNPTLLVMDEPTEGLAPVIVAQVEAMLAELAAEGGMAVLLIEQNIGVAAEAAETVAVMVNGRIARVLPARELAGDRDLQQRLLGVGRHEDEAEAEAAPPPDPGRLEGIWQVEREGPGGGAAPLPNRWNLAPSALHAGARPAPVAAAPAGPEPFRIPPAERFGRTALVAGTFDTKARELLFLRDRLRARGLTVRTVDLSTSGRPSTADVPPLQVAAHHPGGSAAVFTGDRGAAVTAMGEAFARWIVQERGIGGVVSAGGSGNTALATAGMRALPVGVPKVMVSTVASGQVGPYVGASDILMMHSVADVQGLNRITETVLANAAHALGGMIAGLPTAAERTAAARGARPAIGLTMFGVTTPCVQAVTAALGQDFDCLVFHATGTGGRAMEALGLSDLLAGFIDITTTEVADMLVGGVFPADRTRFSAAIRTGLPYVGSVGALDMVNFGPRETVPEAFRGRTLVVHNPAVTLMRTTAEENARAGEWIGERLNRMEGPVRFLLPEGGVSALDAPGRPFHDPAADAALFAALERTVRQTPRRQVLRVKAHINDPAFAEALVAAFRAIAPA